MQNINQYQRPRIKLKFALESNDIALTTDELDYNQEVVFSPYLIAETYGPKLPINIDIDNKLTVQPLDLKYKTYDENNIFISQNFYSMDGEDFTCFSANSSCDIGLTGIDNGLVDKMSGETITFTQGLFDDSYKFTRLYYDRRFKMFQVTGHTSTNERFSGFDKTILYEVVSEVGPEGKYHELYGGFYQGFYKLYGFDYEVIPERLNKGWTVEMLLKPRLINKHFPNSGETTLNEIYPENKNTFFYFGTRAENKFYHHADGMPISGYTRITTPLANCLETCSCCLLGSTDRCVFVYPPRSKDGKHDPHKNYGCHRCGAKHTNEYVCETCGCPPTDISPCGWECQSHCDGETESIQSTCETDPIYDSMSNALSFKLCGDPKNPSIGVKVLSFTGDCETTGTCENKEIVYSTGYTITEYCTEKRIYDICLEENIDFLNEEHWFLVDFVWERYTWLDTCDLWYRGGIGDITEIKYLESLANNTPSLITVPYTQTGGTTPEEILITNLNEKWLIEKFDRVGRLKIYVNGRIFDTIENFEEVVPRGLNTEKEKQVGVPFNISWGGGTQGLIENLTFSSCTTTINPTTTTTTTNSPTTQKGPYIQDPECLPPNDLSGTTFSKLETNILIEQNFAGTFEGGISQFRMYVEPLSSPEIKHNFYKLKDRFNLFNPDCPDCSTESCKTNDFEYEIIGETGWWSLDIVPQESSSPNPFSNGEDVTVSFNPTFKYGFNTNTTIENPSPGNVRLNNYGGNSTTTTTTYNSTTKTTTTMTYNQNSSTEMAISSIDVDGGSINSFLVTLDSITSPVKGNVKISNINDSSQYLLFDIINLTYNPTTTTTTTTYNPTTTTTTIF